MLIFVKRNEEMLNEHYQWSAHTGTEVISPCVVALFKLMRRRAGTKHVWGFVGARYYIYIICRVHIKYV